MAVHSPQDMVEPPPPPLPQAELIPSTALLESPPLNAALWPTWPMVAIKTYQKHGTNPPIIFPPANHENLHISPNPPPHIHIDYQEFSLTDSSSLSDSDSNSSSSFSPSESPVFSSPKSMPMADASKRLSFDSWTEILFSKVYSTFRFLWSNIASTRGVLTFRSAATMAAVVVSFLYFRQRRRLRSGEDNRNRLLGIITEREQKINQLLDQISRLNQVLLASHRVPAST